MSDFERPYLIVAPAATVERARLRGGPSRLHIPERDRQRDRLAPRFLEVERVFEERRVQLQADVTGVAPELVLVLELAGTVEEFMNAVQRVPGAEWLGESEEVFEADEDFYDEDDPERAIAGQLFLVLTNADAMREILSLWRRFEADPDAAFPWGLGRWKYVFLQLRTIRPWDATDRLDRTGVIREWRARLAAGEEVVPAEVELWFRPDEQARVEARDSVRSLIRATGGEVVAESELGEISYHALLAHIPAEAVPAIADARDAMLVRSADVMFFRPIGQAVVPLPDDEALQTEEEEEEEEPPEAGPPLIALLDGLPIANHRLLNGRLIVDDPDGWADLYPVRARFHGTAMASLIVRGDLDANEPAASRTLYVRPILRPDERDFREVPTETVPDDVLFVDLLVRSVRRLFESADGEGAAPTVRIVNLSVCDRALQFGRFPSPIARAVDWLSWRYGVLFVVSAGNHGHSITLPCTPTELDALTSRELEQLTVGVVADEAHRRRILAPGEAINSLTVGAAHSDTTTEPLGAGLRDLVESPLLFSPINAVGLGFRRSIKPDVLINGGRQAYVDAGFDQGSCTCRPDWSNRPPGQRAAAPGVAAGELGRSRYLCGTSNAAAMASRAAASIYDENLAQVRAAAGDAAPSRELDGVLLKAVLVHTASWDEASERLRLILSSSRDARAVQEYTARLIGYGAVRLERALASAPERASMLGWGALQEDLADVYQIPLPPSLSGRGDWRRLTVTLAWYTPINPLHRLYRRAHLWFDVANNAVPVDRAQAQWQMVRRGTVQHEIFEGTQAGVFADGDAVEVRVNCRADAGALGDDIAYALVVSFEVAPGIDVAVYDEVAARIRPRVEVAPRP